MGQASLLSAMLPEAPAPAGAWAPGRGWWSQGRGEDASSLSDWAPGAFALRRDRAKSGTAEAVEGGVAVQWEEAQREEGGVSETSVTPTASVGTGTEEFQDGGMLAEDMGLGEGEGEGEAKRQGWRTDSYVRGLLGLWGGLRGHAKAAAIESHEQEEQAEERKAVEGEEGKGGTQVLQLASAEGASPQPGLAGADARGDVTAASMAVTGDVAPELSEVEAVEDDVGPEEEDVGAARPQGSVSHRPCATPGQHMGHLGSDDMAQGETAAAATGAEAGCHAGQRQCGCSQCSCGSSCCPFRSSSGDF